MFRWLGFILIIAGTSSAGIVMATKLKQDIFTCHEAMRAISFIRSEIEFYLTPLEQIFSQVAEQIVSPLGGILKETGQAMQENPGLSPGLLFKQCAGRSPSSLPQNLVAILSDTFVCLGKQDILAQTRALDAARERISSEVSRLEAEKGDRGRQYRTIGVCAGIAIAILLI